MAQPAHPSNRTSAPRATRVRRTGRRAGRAVLVGLALSLALAGCRKSIEDQIAEIRIQQEIGSVQESVDALRRVLDREPNHPEANYLLGTAQLQLGQPSLAIWPLELASRDPSMAVKANLALGAAFLALDQFEQARQSAEKAIELSADDPDSRVGGQRLIAASYASEKDWEKTLEQADRLLAEFPADPEGLSLRATALIGLERFEEASETMQRIWNDPELAASPAAARAGMGLVRIYETHLDDSERAEAQLQQLLDRFPSQQQVVTFAIQYYNDKQQPERAIDLLRASLESDPTDLWIVGRLADNLIQQDRGEEARALGQETVELLDNPGAWITLSQIEKLLGDDQAALEAFERTLEMLPGVPDNLRFRHANLLVDVGRVDDGEKVASEIEEGFYRDLALGRIAAERGENEKALALLASGLQRWPNNASARYLTGKVAMRLGRMDRAVEELRESSRVDPMATDAAIELGLISLQQGRPKQAIADVSRLLKEGRGERLAKAVRVAARAQRESGDYPTARKNLAILSTLPGHAVEAALDHAELESEVGGPAAAIRAIEKSDLDLGDPANEPLLRAWTYYEITAGRPEAALARVDGAIAAHPEVAAYHDLRARVLVELGRPGPAAEAVDAALAIDPDLPSALEAKARLAQTAGRLDEARELLDRAAAADEANADLAYAAAQIELAAGNLDAAVERLELALQRNPMHTEAANDLAWILAERRQDLDRALALATLASRSDPSATILDTLGWVQLQRGEDADAVVTLEKALALDPDAPSIAYRLGVALTHVGEAARARALFEQALESGPFPESGAARDQLARLGAGS